MTIYGLTIEEWLAVMIGKGFFGALGMMLGGAADWFFVGYAIMCAFVGLWADRRGRNGILWFVLSLITIPIVTIVILLCIGKKAIPTTVNIS